MDIKDWKKLRDRRVRQKYKKGFEIKQIVADLAISKELVIKILGKNYKEDDKKNKKRTTRGRKKQ